MARVHLGLTDRDFGRLTPRLLDILLDRHREQTQHAELMTGIIASTIANFAGKVSKKQLGAADFLPGLRSHQEKLLSRKAQIAAQVARVRASFAAITTKVIKANA